MPRVSLYLSNEIYERVRDLAKEKEMSLSGYINNVMKKYYDTWPEGFFEYFFGIMKDDPLELPEKLPWEEHRKKTIDDFVKYLDSLDQ